MRIKLCGLILKEITNALTSLQIKADFDASEKGFPCVFGTAVFNHSSLLFDSNLPILCCVLRLRRFIIIV